MIDNASTIKKGVDVQPKFCPKEGTHNSRLKKMRMRTAPAISKFCKGFFAETCFREKKKQPVKIVPQIAAHTHSMVRHP